ncbi:MFS general substrate transporter [Myriangium duriaei CBS 260.36]|uniref:MFS general substrate transporter n=1 Tax=Myriangium duriaei CBS 260.36 TaxID=1168546 RepID=A0A9P4J531_9PEZI|nr:MFS general substrate transporter [Myriangium duriaei CBS 260.36]
MADISTVPMSDELDDSNKVRPPSAIVHDIHGVTNVDDVDDWATNPRNPYLWSRRRKIATVTLVSSIGFVCTMGSSIYAPGRDQVAADFNLSDEASVLPVSLYNAGMGLGPLIASPLSETFGRRAVYLVVLPLFCLFVMGSALSHDLLTLGLCRLFAGVFASPGVAIAAATISDMYRPSERTIPLIIYYTTPTLGALTGPLIGGFVVAHKSWRWTAWTTLFFSGPVFLPMLFTRESYKKVIMQPSDASSAVPSRQSLQTFLTRHLLRPLHMLLTEPIVSFLCLYMSFQFGLLYAFVVSSPMIYANVYNFSRESQSLTFLGLIAGNLLACLFLILLEIFYYRPRRQQHPQPESRLHGAMVGSVLLPIGLLLFATLSRSSVHPILPIIAQTLTMLASLSIYIPSGTYLMASYGAAWGASASGANSLLRYALAACFPLFTDRMLNNLGPLRAEMIWAGMALLMAGIPWALKRWGPALRARSQYVVDD